MLLLVTRLLAHTADPGETVNEGVGLALTVVVLDAAEAPVQVLLFV